MKRNLRVQERRIAKIVAEIHRYSETKLSLDDYYRFDRFELVSSKGFWPIRIHLALSILRDDGDPELAEGLSTLWEALGVLIPVHEYPDGEQAYVAKAGATEEHMDKAHRIHFPESGSVPS